MYNVITNLIQNTTPKGSSPSDPFWDRSEVAFYVEGIFHEYIEKPWQIPTSKGGSATVSLCFRARCLQN